MGNAVRERLLEAMLIELAEHGYESMTVEGALGRAGVSQEMFAAEFRDKDACLFAAYEQLTDRLIGRTVERCDPRAPWPERIRGGLETILEELAARPAMTLAMTRAFPAIRPSAYRRYVELLEAFAPFLKEGRDFVEAEEELPGEVEMLAVGAAEAIVFDEIEAGRTAQLPAMLPAILFSVLVPFLGPTEASAAMQSASV